MPEQQLAQRNAALEAFDELSLRQVAVEDGDTPSAFQASFRSTAAELEPDERIDLEIYARESKNMLNTTMYGPHGSQISFLSWKYDAENNVNSIITLLTSKYPELASLRVDFEHHCVLDFVSGVLERFCTKLKVLEMPPYTKGDLPRFFAALGQSQVSALTLCSDDSPEFSQGLCEYLAKDLLVRLKVWMNYKQVPTETMMSLAKCTRLATLEMSRCEFSEPTVFAQLPKSITKLVLDDCTFVGGFEWSFLADSGVRELDFDRVGDVDGSQLGSSLAVHLRGKGLEKLRICGCVFVDETLAAVGVELGRTKRLELGDSDLNGVSVELISLVLQSPSNEMKELNLLYDGVTASSIENHLVPALKHPNCNLAELSFWTFQEDEAAAKAIENRFCNRRALLALLQAQQVRMRNPGTQRRNKRRRQ